MLVNLPATNVQRGGRSKAKTLGLQHLQPLDVGAGSGPPGGARMIHHGPDELLVWQDSVPDEVITFPVKEGNQHSHPLSSSVPDLVNVRRPGESCI
jgi:hypothetical protein